MAKEILKNFIFPKMSNLYIIRMALVALSAYLFFSYICIPIAVRGISMEPTYSDGGVNLIWRFAHVFSAPERFEVVGVRLAGRKVMLLKRIVALEGETVEFREGSLFVNGKPVDEPYIKYPCDWTLAPRTVEKGNVYVVGDNRNVPIRNHIFGQTSQKRIVGVPLW